MPDSPIADKNRDLDDEPAESGLSLPGDVDPKAKVLEDAPARPPATLTRQVAQLVLIPALIVLASVAVIYPIARIAGGKESIDHLVSIVDRSDSLTKDRWLAAYRLATIIATLKDSQQRADLNAHLIQILRKPENRQDAKLQRYLVLAIAQLRQPGNIDVVLEQAASPEWEVRHAVAQSLREWYDPPEAHRGLDVLIALLGDDEAEIRGLAASALGNLARTEDTAVMEALKLAMNRGDAEEREAAWDAAIACAKLGDQEGSRLVAHLLLNRAQLSGQLDMTPEHQDRIILAALSGASKMKDAGIWAMIRKLADDDQNVRVRLAARKLVLERDREE